MVNSNPLTATEPDAQEAWELPRPKQILSASELSILNERSNFKGFVQLTGHLAVMGASGYLWGTNQGNWLIAIPALIIYGFSFASMFAPMHECVHRTAFASNRLNDAVAWVAGVLSFYNSTFYRRYHKWHHRYTQIPGKDPELSDIKLRNLGEYLWEISSLSWWIGKLRLYYRVAMGQLSDFPYVPETARAEVINSTRWQLTVYAVAIAFSIAVQQPWFVVYWLVPLAVGQPILRVILLAEHTGCSYDDNPLTNTRTTLTLWMLRFMMWNMPFHAEHHLYPSIPFHALKASHEKLRPHFAHIEPGYFKVNADIVGGLGG